MTICLCACGGTSTGDDTTGNTTTTTQSTTTTTITTTTTTTTVDDGKVTYSVTVLDENGAPVPGAFVQLCLEACIPCMTNAQGVASYSNMAVADYKVSFITVPAGYELPTDNYYFEEDTYEMTLVLKAAN
jgi:hypothetical protein